MNEQTRLHDRPFSCPVPTFDALTDVLQNLVERDRRNPPHWQAMPGNEMDFATEWQMEATTEEVHSAS
ncbi:MAG: hypothetical protein ACRELF_21495 [Gemmataceae bacterium]